MGSRHTGALLRSEGRWLSLGKVLSRRAVTVELATVFMELFIVVVERLNDKECFFRLSL